MARLAASRRFGEPGAGSTEQPGAQPMTRAFLALVLCLTASAVAQQPAADKLVYPIIPKVGGVAPLPDAAEQPRKGAKVGFEIPADARPADLNKGVERVARLLNLYGSAGLKAAAGKIPLGMHRGGTEAPPSGG